jgi:hypothetical protein
MCAVEKPKLRERKMGVVVRFVHGKIYAGDTPRQNEWRRKEKTGAKPSRSVTISSAEWQGNEEW